MTTEETHSVVPASGGHASDIPSGPPAQLKQIFREQLLSLTLKHSSNNVPAYAVLKPYADRIKSVDDLRELPLFYKKAMIEDPAAFRNPFQETVLTQHTGGTSGNQLEIH